MYFLYKFRDIDNSNNDEKTMNYTKPAPKTAAEKMKAYRERKKQKKIDEQNTENPTSTLNFTKPAAKTVQQRNKSYRERQQQKKIVTAQHINVANIVCKNEYVGLLYSHVHAQ